MIIPDRNMGWFRLLFQRRGSTLPRLGGRLLVVFIVACVATALYQATGHAIDLTPTPFTLIGLALGVFLGFRNNTSYDRYWEGRRLWGQLVNDSRSFARLVLSTISAEATPEGASRAEQVPALHRDLVYRMIAYVHSLRLHLRGETHYGTELSGMLPDGELASLAEERNVPVAIVQRMSDVLQGARRHGLMRDIDGLLFEQKLSALMEVQGGCERIKSTPIPWSYTVLIHRIVAIYCFALPFGLVATTVLLTPIVTALIAYAFLGLDAVGDEIEEPFGVDANDLPLFTLSRMIEVNLRQRLGESNLPPLVEPDGNRQLM